MKFPWRSETKNPLWLRAGSPPSSICAAIDHSQKVDRGSKLQLFQGTGVQHIVSRKLGSGKLSGQYVVFQARCSMVRHYLSGPPVLSWSLRRPERSARAYNAYAMLG
jgi:hypothetical protein